ncbi:hypothetical protein HYH03_005107 [Edaphochlamys debaryana]|uniref:Apple domain-containing protein n=1 Tax=Edaphochlamys debaryana TaxID=47281 RepID=A0A836C2K2_9CHLO|nr:hypothetical protein HYH03_005107 [Edaphochlamys debaryana]|eukprot:KAG2496689.1 hypothetical protein HYH03_005107 [Edaphochlamys debaryana]
MQEVIHNFGLVHGWRSGVEYEDHSTSMGRGNNCPSAPELWRLGWATPIDTLSASNFPENRYLRYMLPYTYAGPSGAYLKLQPNWASPYDKNVYLALRGNGNGDWEIEAEFKDVISLHEGEVPADNRFDSWDDAHYTIITTIGQNRFYDMNWRRLAIKTQSLSNGRMEVWVCRYRSAASECANPNDNGGTVCNPVSGYTVAADVDHPGDDIVNKGGVAEAAAACSAAANCKGFNSQGWVKQVVSPTSAHSGMCLYAKVVTNCQKVSGYTVQADVDHNGDDIKQETSLQAAAAACNANAACRGFNSWNFVKTVVTPTSPFQGLCLYTKVATECQAVNGFTVKADVDHNGDDISNKASMVEAADACRADSRCKGFNSWGWYKTTTTPVGAYPGLCLYTKTATSCQSFEGYQAAADTDHNGNDIAQAGSVTAALSACNSDPTCTGFSSGGFTKYIVTPTGSSRGMCLYTKLAPTILDAAGCGAVQERYGLLPQFNWGSTPAPYQQLWVRSTCEPEKICRFWQSRWAIQVFVGWGNMPGSLQPSWTKLNCDQFWSRCQDVSGFTVTPDVDHNGDDISQKGSIAEAAAACRAEATCKGFNSQGWYKTTVTPTSSYQGMCFYVKQGTSCTPVSGYTATANTDHNGDDIDRKGSLAEAAAACNADSRCKGFNNGGYYKTVVSPTSSAQGTCLYVKVVTRSACTRPDRWCGHGGASLGNIDCDGDGLKDWICTDLEGNRGTIRSTDSCGGRWPEVDTSLCPAGQLQRLPGADWACVDGYDVAGDAIVVWTNVGDRATCRELCRQDTRCEFFVLTNDRRCVLKSNYLTGPSGANGPSSGVSTTCLGSTNYGQFQCVPGWDVKGDHVEDPFYVSHVSECRYWCLNSVDCVFFLYLEDGTCVLKDNTFKGRYGTTQPNSAIAWACFQVWYAAVDNN